MQPTHESSVVHHQAITEYGPTGALQEAWASHLFSAPNARWTSSPRRPRHACTPRALLFALCCSATTRPHLPAVAVTPCCPLQPL